MGSCFTLGGEIVGVGGKSLTLNGGEMEGV